MKSLDPESPFKPPPGSRPGPSAPETETDPPKFTNQRGDVSGSGLRISGRAFGFPYAVQPDRGLAPQRGRVWELDASRPYSLVVGQNWELRGYPRSEMLDGQRRGHSWRLARIPRRVPDCGLGAVSGARASPRSAHFGDGTQRSAEHGLSIMVERVSLVAGPGRRREDPAAGHTPHQLP